MADKAGSEPTTTPAVPRVRDPQFREVYANASFTGLSPFDITLIFAKATDIGGQTVQVDQVSVTVSPQHFKALCKSLNETLKAYENTFGELKIPDSDISPSRDAAQIEQLIRATRDKKAGGVPQEGVSTSSSTEKKRLSKRSRSSGRA
jgi:hypothetical protein